MSAEIYWLVLTILITALMWVPYALNSFAVRGIIGTMMYPGKDAPSLSEWAQRAKSAHYNAVENLVLFAPLVVVCHFYQSSLDMNAVALAAMIYFYARLVHYIVYTLKIPFLRTLAFLAGWGVQIYLVYVLLTSLA